MAEVARYLAWDTSSRQGALAAFEVPIGEKPARGGGSVHRVAEWRLDVSAAQHSELLLWAIHQTLRSARWELGDLRGLAAGAGPGSFTGLRIGLATARSLADARGIPVRALSSLEVRVEPARAWAAAFAPSARPPIVVAAVEAAKGEVFTWQAGRERVEAPAKLAARLERALAAAPRGTGWARAGDGWESGALAALSARTRAREIALPSTLSQGIDPGALAVVAARAWSAKGKAATVAENLAPRYLRDADATRRLRAGQLKPAPTGTL